MAPRALIIAIEEYPDASGLARTLDGTLDAALSFRQWLEARWQADGVAGGQVLFLSSPVHGGGDASQRSVLKALKQLKEDGRNATEELFVYFSGHGFSFVDRPGDRADIIVTADFEDLDLSGHACIRLDQVIAWLRDHMGPGHHYYFVDACRNSLDGHQVQPGAFLPWDTQRTEEATTYLLQSTTEGDVAAVGGAFPKNLIQGLKGHGKAKTWDPSRADAMLVHYGSLRDYLRETVTGQTINHSISGVDGESDAVFAVISPVPVYTCRVTVDGGAPDDAGSAAIKRFRSPEESRPIRGNTLEIQLEPDYYTVAVDIDGSRVEPRDPVSVALFDDVTLTFTKPAPDLLDMAPPPDVPGAAVDGADDRDEGDEGDGDDGDDGDDGGGGGRDRDDREEAAPPPPARPRRGQPLRRVRKKANVELRLPPMLDVELRNMDSDVITKAVQGRQSIEPGRYELRAMDERDGALVETQTLVIGPGQNRRLDFTSWKYSLPLRAIAGRLPDWGGAPDFSESLSGPVIDYDLDLWLALIGGARVAGSTGRYSKLSNLPLYDFGQESPGASPVYVLAGFETDGRGFDAMVTGGVPAGWRETVMPGDMRGLKHLCFHPGEGSCLVSFARDGGPPYTVASYAMANHATVVTVTEDPGGRWSVFQYILPIDHLAGLLVPDAGTRFANRNHLMDIRYLCQSGRAFASRHPVDGHADPVRHEELKNGNWLDPVGTARTGYELLRQGGNPVQIANHLNALFPGLPDSAALDRLAGNDVATWAGTPLFLDGLRAFAGETGQLPLPESLLDYASPWTAWFGAPDRPR